MNIKDFDKIYVIHLSDRPDRLKVILPEFAKVGLLDKLDIRWTCRKGIYKRMAPTIPELNVGIYVNNIDRQAGVIGCTLNHYELIRTSYERGFDHIMIFENDIKFNCEEDVFNLVISNIPDDYKICMLDYTGCKESKELQSKLTKDTVYFKLLEGPTWWAHGAWAYCISKEGMKEIIRIFEEDNYFTCFDCCFDHWPTKEIDVGGNKKTIMDGFYINNHIPIISTGWSPSSILSKQPHN